MKGEMRLSHGHRRKKKKTLLEHNQRNQYNIPVKKPLSKVLSKFKSRNNQGDDTWYILYK